MINILSFDDLEKEINKIDGKPEVLEVLWDGGTVGWFLRLVLYSKNIFSKEIHKQQIGYISLGGDIRLFTGKVPPWTEVELAKQIGKKAVEKYGLEFYFPSENEPDDDCPPWNKQHLADRCVDCGKLILPTSTKHIPKKLCYKCHLKREENKKIINEVACHKTLYLYLYKAGNYKCYSSHINYENASIFHYFKEAVQQHISLDKISEVSITNDTLTNIMNKINKDIENKLLNFTPSKTIHPFQEKFTILKKITFNTKTYELELRFNTTHRQIWSLIEDMNLIKKAIDENYEIRLLFKNNFNYRDTSILRYIKQINQDTVEIKKIIQNYKNLLTKTQVKKTIQKLEQFNCIHLERNTIYITQLGKNIT